MKNSKFVLLLCLGLSIIALACNNRREVETLQKATMDIHDEAMKNIAIMNRQGRELKKERAAKDSLQMSTSRLDSIIITLGLIDRAQEDMYTWMNSYRAPEDTTPIPEALLYLEQKKKEISKNEEDIKKAMELAKRLLTYQ